MPDKYIQVHDSPPPGESIRIQDVDDQQAIAQGDVASAKWSVEKADGTLVRLTTGDIVALVSIGVLSVPDYAVRTAYARYSAFVSEGTLYRVLFAIPATNTSNIETLVSRGQIEALIGHDAQELSIQWSGRSTGPWTTTPNNFIRLSTNGGRSWSDPWNWKGRDGIDGIDGIDGRDAPPLMIQWSADGSTNWSGVVSRFVRVSTDGGATWTDAAQFQGIDGQGQSLIVDLHSGLRAATVADFGKIGIGPEGSLYRVKRTANPGHDATGMLNAYTHTDFRGVLRDSPNLPRDGQIYYNTRRHQFYIYVRQAVTNILIAQPISPVQALGANTIWLGEVDDQYQAVHAVENFDSNNAYYAIYSDTLHVLDNSSYMAPTGITYSYQWVPAIPDIDDEDKVNKADLNPILRISRNLVRRSELENVYHLRAYNVAAVFPDVDQVIITFAGISIINTGIDSTWTGEALAIVPAIAEQILAGTARDQESWTVRTQLLKDSEVRYTIDTIVYIDITEPPSTAINHNTRRIEVVEDKTADMFVHREPGDFANNVDPRVAGVAIVLKNAANQNALNSGSFDFDPVTFAQTAVGVLSDDTNVYDLIVRTAKSLGRVEGEFRVYEMSTGTDFALPLRQLIQEDDNWYYYFTVDARAGDSWFIQYRGTHPHNTYNGDLGEHPLAQVDRRVEGGILGRKTSQLIIVEEPGVFADLLDENIASITTVERTTANDTAITDNNFNWDGQTWTLPSITHTSDGNRYYLVVRIPKALGDISNQFRILTTDPSKAVRTINTAEANDATYNYYLADTNTDSITWTLQRQGQVLRTRYLGEVPGTGGVSPTPTPGVGSGVLAYESIPNETTIQARQIVTYRNGYYGSIVTHTKQSTDNPASDTARWRLLSISIGNWIAGNYPAGTIAKAGGEQWIADEAILAADPSPTSESNTKWKRLTSHEGLTALITRVDDAFDDINTNRAKIAEDETKLENFIQTVNNYFSGHGEGDVTAQEIAHLFALLDEYNPTVDRIRSTLGLVSETQAARRLIQVFEDQTTLISNADVPSEAPVFQHNNTGLLDRRNYFIYVMGLQGSLRIRVDSSNYPTIGSISEDPHIQYYLNGDTDQEDAHILNAIAFVQNELFICMQTNVDGGTDPLAFLAGSTLRPYALYTPITDIPANGNITYGTQMALAPTNADHDVSFVNDFDVESPSRRIRINSVTCRGWHFNDFDSTIDVTLCKILAQWYIDVRWILNIYENYRILVEQVDQGRPGAVDPRTTTWVDAARDPNDARLVVERPPYPSLDALKAAIPLPTLKMYFKSSVSNFVMNIANHDIHSPLVNKLVQIPDTHYGTPPRVTFLPTVARENEVFQLVSDQYRPDSDHSWAFDPVKHTVYDRDLIGASLPTVIGSTPYAGFGRTSASVGNLPAIFQGGAIGALVVFNDDPEHIHLYINSQRVSASDIVIIEMHGTRSDGSPIVRTASFSHTGTRAQWRHFQARVSGAYNIFDFSESLSISIKRGNTYLYLNDANNPATPEWETGLLHTAGLYKGKADGSFTKAIIVEAEEYNELVAISEKFVEASAPDNNLGVDHNKWLDTRNGKEYIKRAGNWHEIIDYALESEISRAKSWTTIPNNTAIPADFITSVNGKYYGAKTAHTKTSSSSSPATDTTNWIDLSYEPVSRYIELSIRSAITLPQYNATSIPLTYLASPLQAVNSSGFLARNAAGNGITLKQGVYAINMHLVVNVNDNNKRTNINVEIHDGTSAISTNLYSGYIRGLGEDFAVQSIDSFHKINLTSDKTIQVRVKLGSQEDLVNIDDVSTNGGSIVISKA